MKAYKVAQWTFQSEINCYHDYFQLQNYAHINKADTLIIPQIPSDDIKIDCYVNERVRKCILEQFFPLCFMHSLFFLVACCCWRRIIFNKDVNGKRRGNTMIWMLCFTQKFLLRQKFKLMMRGASNPFKHCKNTKYSWLNCKLRWMFTYDNSHTPTCVYRLRFTINSD